MSSDAARPLHKRSLLPGLKSPVELVSWQAAGEILCPGNPPHRKTMERWFRAEPVSPIVRLSSKKSALNAVVLREIIERRSRSRPTE
jgi:hypothetical protein